MIWREKRLLLFVLGALLLANTMYFFTYRVRYQSRLDSVEQDLAQKEAQLEQAHLARVKAEQRYQSYRQIERDVKVVFDDYWSTEPERLTKMIAEVKRLTVASSLEPAGYGFTKGQVKNDDRARKRANIGATEVGIGFGVQGSYEQVRRLINLLELSQQFVIIDQIALSSGDGANLTVTLHLKTLFRDDNGKVASQRL